MPAHVTNICFHGIGEPERELEPGEDRYWISQDAYEDILDAVAGRPEVRISFDDGNHSDVALGLPGLLTRGLSATFFVLAGRLGLPGSVDRLDIRLLRVAGMRIEVSHVAPSTSTSPTTGSTSTRTGAGGTPSARRCALMRSHA